MPWIVGLYNNQAVLIVWFQSNAGIKHLNTAGALKTFMFTLLLSSGGFHVAVIRSFSA